VSFAGSSSADALGKFGAMIVGLSVPLGVLLLLLYLANRANSRWTRRAAILVFLSPALFLLLVGLVVPVLRTTYLSFRGDDSTRFVGLNNFEWAFDSEAIRQVLLTTLLWIIIAPLVASLAGLALALAVDRLRGQAIYKSFIVAPMAVSFVGASIIWRFIYAYREPSQPQVGLLNEVAMTLGWHDPPNWILAHTLNNFLLIVILVWVQTGFAMVVLSAAIKMIPETIIEAAVIDGARGASMLFRVQLPMIRNSFVVVLVALMITTLKVFDIVRTMTGGNFGTQVLSNEMYSQSFVQFNAGRGSALAVILFLAVLPLVAYNTVQLRKERARR
jgi:alpha-glucoside transport system permease protein